MPAKTAAKAAPKAAPKTARQAAPRAWHPDSWRDKPAAQQPDWPDEDSLRQTCKSLSELPPLVFAGESRNLLEQLASVSRGEAFLLQAGDCAESFDALSADLIRDKLRVILQMAVVLTWASGMPVVKVGRIAGQFAKPRSSPTETVDEVELPSFRGHMVNDPAFDSSSRMARADRLLTAYHQSSSTLNLLRAFTKGGFADLNQVHEWNQEFVASSPLGQRYEQVAAGIDAALSFMEACGLSSDTEPKLRMVDLYTSHEALILEYEEALTRVDSLSGDWYDCSAHMLWVGERTRQTDGAHLEFLRGVHNPLACKLGPSATPAEALAICETLNPERIAGRLTLISRMGADKVAEGLAPLVEAVSEAGHPVVWACDPMHGNTFTSDTGLKTRHFDDICEEINGFFEVHRKLGTHPGGIHLELTGENVTECLGGSSNFAHSDLVHRYETVCDPRLNATQSLDMAFRVAELLRG